MDGSVDGSLALGCSRSVRNWKGGVFRRPQSTHRYRISTVPMRMPEEEVFYASFFASKHARHLFSIEIVYASP
jgi:hypothetical protein